jgi:protocatechuate 3,4-dioxygenase beta subunit
MNHQRLPVLLLALVPLGFQAAPQRKAAPARPAPVPLIEGVVNGPDGRPIADAFVEARPVSRQFDGAVRVTARTDAAGRFHVTLKSNEPHDVRVESKGLAARKLEKVRPGTPLTVTLTKGAVIAGTVRDATGAPVARARVEALEEFGGVPFMFAGGGGWEPDTGRVEAVTDERGRFRLEGVAPGLHTVRAAARGFGRARRPSIAAGRSVDLTLLPGGSIVGSVIGSDGRPAAGALVRVEAEAPQMGAAVPLEKTDSAGRFEIVGLEAGPYRLVARHEGYAPSVLSGVVVERAGEVRADLVLEGGVPVTGRLVGGSEQPVAGRAWIDELSGARTPRSLADVLRADAGADGVFRIEGVPAGSHVLVVTAPGHSSQRVDVQVRPKDGLADLGDLFLETGLTIRGRVSDRDGAPIADAQIRGFQPRTFAGPPAEARSEVDGSFTLGGLSPGGYRLIATAPGYGSEHKPVEAGAEGVDLVLRPAGQIAGQVVDEAGRPIESFRVSAQPASRESGRVLRMGPDGRSFADSTGRFVLEDVAEGTYVVQASAPDRASASVSDVKVTGDGTTNVGQLRLAAGATVRGSVVDPNAAPIAGATVTVHGPGRSFSPFGSGPQAMTDSAGGFELKGVPAGTLEVAADHPQFAQGRVAVEVDPAQGPAEARIVLTQGGRIEGIARKRDGTGVPGTYVQVSPMRRGGGFGLGFGAGGREMVTVGPDGSFLLEHVPAGRAMVVLMNRAGDRFTSAQSKEVEVREGESTLVEFHSRDILLSGRVTRRGSPLARVRLNLHGSGNFRMMMAVGTGEGSTGGPQRMTAVTREDGSYEMLVDEAGRFQVTAESPDGSASYPSRPIEVPDTDAHVADIDYSGVAVTGVVLDRDTEQPIANANVWARPQKPTVGFGGSAAETKDDGRFSLELDTGEYTVTARAEGYGGEEVRVDVGDSPPAELRLALSRGLSLAGKIVDQGGRGVAGLFVMATPQSADRSSVGSGTATVADGSFVLTGLTDRPHSLLARSDLGMFAFRTGVRPGDEVQLTLRPGGRALLQVTGPDGAPVEGAFANLVKIGGVNVRGVGGRTSAQGLAEVALPAGPIELEVGKDTLRGKVTLNVAEGGSASAAVELKEGEATP